MKLTFLLLLVCCLQVSAKVYSQDTRISLHLEKINIARALHIIEKKSDYRFLYKDDLLPRAKDVQINVTDKPVSEIIDQLLASTGLSYRLLDNNLIVLATANTVIQDTQVSGTVTDSSTGQPLIGVTIKVQGTNTGTVTDAEGKYSLTVPDNATLEISYIGYQTQTISVNGQTTINIKLSSAASELSQVVVVGYGTQKKLDVTGAVDQVKGEDISKQASTNVVSALQGKVAGVNITNNGQPGSSPQIRIRGLGTVYGNPNPLYVVDGVWYDDISFLNPADIASVSILKDASAESIYGIRAANGVVLITTKNGSSGKMTVNYNAYAGWQHVTNKVKMSNGGEYAQLINEKSIYGGGDSILANPSQYGEGTDWYNQVLRDAFVMNHQISVSGGNDKTTYKFSLGYLDQDGIVETNNYKRITANLQTDMQVFKNLKVGYNIVSSGDYSKDIPGTVFHELYAAAPIVPVKYTDGSYGDPGDYSLGQAIANPQASIDFYNQRSRNYRFNGNAYAELTFLKYFTVRSSFGGEIGQNEVRSYVPVYNATTTQSNTVSTLTLTRGETRNWILENTLTFENTFGKHDVKVLLGQGAQRYKYNKIVMSAQNVPNNNSGDYYLSLGDNVNVYDVDPTNPSNPSYPALSTIASYFGRVNYSYNDRYLLNASLRADGSSKFTGGNRWGYFPSVGVGWVISNENFMQNQHIFNNLKIRGSWGKIGNASVPSNISVLRVDQSPQLTAIFGDPGTAHTGASITSIVPPTTYWERGVGTDIGLDAGFINNKLTLEADFYNKLTQKAIFNIPILASLGTSGSSIIANQADFQNQGIELTLSWHDNVSKDFSYNISGNVAMNDNKVKSVSTGANPIYGGGAGATGGALTTRTIVGEPIGEFYGYQVAGIFQDQNQIDNSAQAGTGAHPGDFMYQDISGSGGKADGAISGLDRVVLGNPNPKYTYGLNTSFTYKQFDLSLDFQGVADVAIYNANKGLRYGNENYPKDFYDNRWHGSGTSNTYPSANIGGDQNYLPNSWFVEDGSYFRIRNMQLGYTLPTSVLDRWGINRFRIYANAQNAFNFFKYTGFSPEVGGTPTNAGIDTNVYPLYATYNFGINLSF